MNGWDHLAGGLSGGFVSTLVVHPLDLLKVRAATDPGLSIPTTSAASSSSKGAVRRPQHNGYIRSARSVLASSGVSGLYAGLTPNLVGNTLAWGLYFHFFNLAKAWLSRDGASPGPHGHLAAGCAAGAATLTVTNPIWVAKTRLCLQPEGGQARYRGLAHVLASLLRHEGLRGWYKGFAAGLIGTSHGAVQFMAYEELGRRRREWGGRAEWEKLSPADYIAMASASKLLATGVTYPYQVVRLRMQDQHANYASSLDAMSRTWAGEGVRGFYKGLLPSLLRHLPATAITFLVYENVSHAVRDWQSSR